MVPDAVSCSGTEEHGVHIRCDHTPHGRCCWMLFVFCDVFSWDKIRKKKGKCVMENVQVKNNPLETEPVSKLLLRYSVPTTLTLMVSYLYNVVDQIFVGQGVGVTGMAAVNVAFPVSILVNAVALMLGDGCAANVSLCLGRREQETANRIFGNTVTWIIASGVIMALVCGIFTPQIVRLFGSTDTACEESAAYLRIIACGIPFQLVCPAFTAIIRADGSPKYTMKCMMTGAAINLILDPVFIFGLKMGVAGAGIATVIGEIAAGMMCLLYLRRLQTICLTAAALRPTWILTREILKLGFPSLLTQGLTALVQIVFNNLMHVCGAASIYGGDIALSVYGMMMKVYQIAHSMFVGVSSAIQPVNGYNFGAENYDRVRKTCYMATGIALVISALWCMVYLLFPRQLAMLFVSDDPLYLDCAVHCFRLHMMAFFLYGVHMTTASFFQGIGKPFCALFIPLVRQGILLIPLALIMSYYRGMEGALIAVPVADVVTFLLCVVLLYSEFRRWKKCGWLTR